MCWRYDNPSVNVQPEQMLYLKYFVEDKICSLIINVEPELKLNKDLLRMQHFRACSTLGMIPLHNLQKILRCLKTTSRLPCEISSGIRSIHCMSSVAGYSN